MRPPRVPPSFFGISFGLAGLGQVWRTAATPLDVPFVVADAIFIGAAAVWAILLAGYLSQGRRQVLADFSDTALGPFISLAVIEPMIFAAALAPSAYTAARLLVIIFLALTLVLGGLTLGQWIAANLDYDASHPGYFLPTAAGPLLGAFAAGAVGLHHLAETVFGVGVISWLVLGSLTLNRLFFHPPLPPSLIPTMAIESAPPVLTGVAYFAINGGRVDFVARALGCYAIVMALVQLRLIPVYARLSYSPGFWAFTFSYAIVATDALLWLKLTRPPGATAYVIVVVTLITLFIVAIAVRTVVALGRGQFFPARQPTQPF
jgi:tellurite resistance protein